jgi:hypothetical protein
MRLAIQNQVVIIDLEGKEKFWSFNFKGHFEIPVAHITRVSFTVPKTGWREVRAPGSFFPGVIKAGTYYTPLGKEFWYATRWRPVTVVFDLKEEKYNRLVVAFPAGTLVESTLREARLPIAF